MNANGNPWLDVPSKPPYVLPCDLATINSYNAKHPNKSDPYHIHGTALPEPFVGSVKAPVILLGLNPGFDLENIEEHARPLFQDSLRNNYCHGWSEFPFYFLNPDLKGGGQIWWEKKLRWLLQKFERRDLSRSLFCVEYFPYHSVHFKRYRLDLPSRQYGFELVRAAVNRRAVIVIMRSRRLWLDVIPELSDYPHHFPLKNPQNTTLSPNNCPDGKFESMVSAIRAHLRE